MLNDTIFKSLPEMMKQMNAGGLFLTTKAKTVNTMVIGWGGVNVYFRMPIFIVPVRISRYAHELLEVTKHFTVSVPRFGDLKQALAFCGTKSGRDFDKFTECKLTAEPGRTVEAPVIKACYLHYECEAVYKQHLVSEFLDKDLDRQIYPDSNYHTFYYGKILDCYTTD